MSNKMESGAAEYSFAHGGSAEGPTADADGVALAAGDAVVMVDNHDPAYRHYVGARGVVEWAQDVFPFAQVIVVFPDEPRLAPLSTFSANVRKEG